LRISEQSRSLKISDDATHTEINQDAQFLMSRAQPLTIYFPIDLRERARKVAKRLRSTTADLVRQGLDEVLVRHEEKFRIEEERKHIDKQKMRGRVLRPLGERGDDPLAPQKLDYESETEESLDLSEVIYAQQAARLLDVLGAPSELRLRKLEAISAVRKHSPLTCPESDTEIVKILEKHLRKLQSLPKEEAKEEKKEQEQETPIFDTFEKLGRVIDDKVGRAINPERIRTRGDE
jgi:hypothetical protein